MFKIYQKYLIQNFFIKFFYITFIFLSLIIILGILEEISFFKDLEKNIIYPFMLTLLNAPITLFEIFPFIFLLTTQFVFYDMIKSEELNVLKKNGLTNLNIIKILFILSIIIGVINVLIYYNLASSLKFYYTNIKNSFSNDNKYLAMVTNSGLWIKDEINDKTLITNSNYIEKNFLKESTINEFDSNFILITKDNITTEEIDQIIISTNFNVNKINNIFSNISTLNLSKLFNLKKEFEEVGYSTDEIMIHLLKLSSMPIFYGVLTVLSSIIMFNFTQQKSLLFHVMIGILMSVMIYYLNFIFNSLGNNGKIPINVSIFFPLIIVSLFSIIGLVNINEK